MTDSQLEPFVPGPRCILIPYSAANISFRNILQYVMGLIYLHYSNAWAIPFWTIAFVIEVVEQIKWLFNKFIFTLTKPFALMVPFYIYLNVICVQCKLKHKINMNKVYRGMYNLMSSKITNTKLHPHLIRFDRLLTFLQQKSWKCCWL